MFNLVQKFSTDSPFREFHRLPISSTYYSVRLSFSAVVDQAQPTDGKRRRFHSRFPVDFCLSRFFMPFIGAPDCPVVIVLSLLYLLNDYVSSK